MKFKDAVLTLPDEEYRNLPAFSYSLLKELDDLGPTSLITGKIQKQSDALEFGSLVDILLTAPDTKSERFWTKTLVKPSASLLELANALLVDLHILDEGMSYITHETIQKKIKVLDIWSNIKDPDKLQAKYDDPIFWEYIKESYEAKGKIIVSQEVLDAAEHCADVLKNHEYTRDFFVESDDIEILFQPSILYTFKGVKGKARLDLIIVDHKNKIIKPFDIKTGSEIPTKFINSFYKFKYYLQVISYLLAIQSITETVEEFKDYKIDTFKFLYVSKKLPDVPVIFEVEEKLLNSFADGWLSSTGEYVTGFLELVNNYKYAVENQIFNVERKVIEKEGRLTLELI